MTDTPHTPISHWWAEVLSWSPRLLGLCLLVVFLFLVLRFVSRAIPQIGERFELDQHLTLLLLRTCRITIIVVAVISALGTVGINVSALVTGLGLTGFALGFALKDTISNLLAGILILLYQPFRMGDSIEVTGFTGTVSTIDLRYTELNHDGQKILIPNSKLFIDPIVVTKSSD